ncbi:hypothetical protein F5X68DRAFT_199242 [Plectosphaerella plurivora]|uniref:Uncharacterized protein n=1 Tax=Plectosphaerella plurivora TaxID=936078 RepID=A0A9P8VKM3_9PEZI|nr:hypothetical protein F5X68DRAFT_199242 [Plectosphaerella plurivora]
MIFLLRLHYAWAAGHILQSPLELQRAPDTRLKRPAILDPGHPDFRLTPLPLRKPRAGARPDSGNLSDFCVKKDGKPQVCCLQPTLSHTKLSGVWGLVAWAGFRWRPRSGFLSDQTTHAPVASQEDFTRGGKKGGRGPAGARTHVPRWTHCCEVWWTGHRLEVSIASLCLAGSRPACRGMSTSSKNPNNIRFPPVFRASPRIIGLAPPSWEENYPTCMIVPARRGVSGDI